MVLGTIYLSGPSYHFEEKNSLDFIIKYFQDQEYEVYSSSKSGFQDSVMKYALENDLGEKDFMSFESNYKKACLLSFALELFYILESDICIDGINDEGEKFGGCETEYIPVVEFQNIEDGFLISAGPGVVEPAVHPFLNAEFLDEYEESSIGDIIDESTSFVDFMTKLVENEYLVVAEEGESLLR